MTINELIEKLEADKDFAEKQALKYRKKLCYDKDSVGQSAIWLSNVIEFEARSNTLYGIIYQLKRLED